MVAILAMVFIVVHSMFMLTVMLLIFTGELVLLYFWNTHYACRGGSSSFGTYCGTFSVVTVYGVGSTYWLIGAALSFKFHFYL